MLSRFTGDTGRKNLIEALCQQEVVAGDQAVAERLASVGQLMDVKPGATIIEQNAGDNDVFFIINGEVAIFVNHQQVATRGTKTVVGEMAAIDPTARRSATVKAMSAVIALKVSADDFNRAGEGSLPYWRHVAQLIGNRLRERSKFHLPANATPIMFVGSSVEGLEVAKEIEAGLKHCTNVITRRWTNRGVFGPSRYTMEDLMKEVDQADFALFVFGPDDKLTSREEKYMAPRDNVILEMGLFIGRLGRERVFTVKDADVDLKIPSDLTGLNPITYKRKAGDQLADAVGTVCTDLEKAISSKGVVTNRMKVGA